MHLNSYNVNFQLQHAVYFRCLISYNVNFQLKHALYFRHLIRYNVNFQLQHAMYGLQNTQHMKISPWCIWKNKL